MDIVLHWDRMLLLWLHGLLSSSSGALPELTAKLILVSCGVVISAAAVMQPWRQGGRWSWCHAAKVSASPVIAGLVYGLNQGVLKPLLARPRPCHELLEQLIAVGECPVTWSMLSNHAVVFAAWAGASVGWKQGLSTFSLVGLALAAGLSRLWLGVHYPTDVIVGWLVGGSCGYVLMRMGERTFGALSRQGRHL